MFEDSIEGFPAFSCQGMPRVHHTHGGCETVQVNAPCLQILQAGLHVATSGAAYAALLNVSEVKCLDNICFSILEPLLKCLLWLDGLTP